MGTGEDWVLGILINLKKAGIMNLKRKGKWEAYFRSMIEMYRKKAEEARKANEAKEAEHHATTKEVEKDTVTTEVEKDGGTTEAKEDHGEAIQRWGC